MATCKECLHFNVCESFCGGIPRIMMLGNNAERDCGYYKPAADVVPKSEVEELKADLEVWKQNRFNIYQMLDLYKMTQQEVAREIFEEIEEYAELQIESLNIAEKVDSRGADFFGGGKQAFVLLLDRLAELKKKYTEGEPNGKGKGM